MVRTWKKDVTRLCELHVWINSRDIPARYIPNDNHKDKLKPDAKHSFFCTWAQGYNELREKTTKAADKQLLCPWQYFKSTTAL